MFSVLESTLTAQSCKEVTPTGTQRGKASLGAPLHPQIPSALEISFIDTTGLAAPPEITVKSVMITSITCA